MKNTFFALVLSLLVVSCSTTPTTPEPQGIEGKWLWTRSVGGFTGHTEWLPEPGTSRVVEFKGDGTYLEYHGGVLSKTLKYEIFKMRVNREGDSADAIRIFDEWTPTRLISNVNRDTLLLQDNMVEGFASTYTRVR